MGLMLAEPGYHTRCFVEWEEWPRAVLIAAQRAGYFAPAPIWTDLRTFHARPFRGAFDTVLAGYPCQPFSAAGKRGGADDPRHLWPDVARVIEQCHPEWVFLENVPGHVTLGLETVLRELWGMGYTPAAGLFSAAEVGAPHQRLRIFILAHTGCAELEGQQRGERDPHRWQVPDGHPALPGGAGLHPPGPGDHGGWAAVLAARPDLAPALGFDDCLAWARHMSEDPEGPFKAAAEPALRRMADGLAHRTRALRLLGNGVHPLAAAHAWRTLAAAHGLRPMDLAAERCSPAPGADDPV
jgi:site-specific DNA-cytosine methylase